MSFAKSVVVVGVLQLWLAPGLEAFAAELTKAEQGCVNVLNKDLSKVDKAATKQISGCLKRHAAGKALDPKDAAVDTLEECIVHDGSGKLEKATDKTAADFVKHCGGSAFPSFGATDALTVNTAGSQIGVDLVHSVFGPLLDQVGLLPTKSEDKGAANCQAGVWKAVTRCGQTKLKEFLNCKKKEMAGKGVAGPIDSADALRDACLGVGAAGQPDDKGKIAKRCSDPEKGIARQVENKCVGENLGTLFPGCGTTTVAETAVCMDELASCRVCKAINAADGLDRDCDLFDDGALDGSCGCGDGTLDGGEACDDGGVVAGDGCDAACQIEPGFSCSGQPSVCLASAIAIVSPAHGGFTTDTSVSVDGLVTNLPGEPVQVRVNGAPVALQPDGTFTTVVALDPDVPFQPVAATLEVLASGYELADRIVLIHGTSTAAGEFSPQSLSIRVRDTGLLDLGAELSALADAGFDLGFLIPSGTGVGTFGGYVWSVDAATSGELNMSVHPRALPYEAVDVDVTVADVHVDLTMDGLFVDCDVDFDAQLLVTGAYLLEPDSFAPSLVDAEQFGPLSSVLYGSSWSIGGSPLCVANDAFQDGLAALENLILAQVETFLSDPDGVGSLDGLPAITIETVLAALDLSGPLGTGLGVMLDSELFAVTEAQTFVSFDADSRVDAEIGAGVGQCLPPAEAPVLVALLDPAQPLPPVGATTPGGASYDIEMSVSSGGLNQLLRAKAECGLLVTSVDELDLGGGPVPLTSTNLGTSLPEFLVLPAGTPLRIDLRPTLAPVVVGVTPLRPTPELEIAHVLLSVVQDDGSENVLLQAAIDARLGMSTGFGVGTLDMTLSTPLAADRSLAILDNPLGVDEAAAEATILPPLLPILLPDLSDALGSFPLPNLGGVTLSEVEVANSGEFIQLFGNLTPVP